MENATKARADLMLDKMGLWVCSEKGCPAISGKAGGKCPRHPNAGFIHVQYVREDTKPPIGSTESILDSMFGKPGDRPRPGGF